MDYFSVERKTYLSAIGEIGGLQSFYLFIGFALMSYFTDIDYHANIVKALFLEKQTD